MAQGTEPKTHLGEGNMKAQLLWKSTASFDSKCSPLTATTPASSFERKCSICKKEKTNQVMEKKWKEVAIGYGQLKEIAGKERNNRNVKARQFAE